MPELTVERLFSDPPLLRGLPQNPRIAPDGRHLAYLRVADDDRERLDLWRVELDSGEHQCWLRGDAIDASGEATAEERAERERRRQFAAGITRFEFSPDGCHLLLPLHGAAWLFDPDNSRLRCLTPADTRQTDMRFSPDGASLTYVRDGDLYRTDIATGRELRLTSDGGAPVSNGIADFVAQEEMHRFEGYWWSPDSTWLAYTRVDESPVQLSQRFEMYADSLATVSQRYPFAGAANPSVRLLVIPAAGGTARELAFRVADDDYLARVGWLGGQVVAQRQSRDQRTLELYAIDPESGDRARLLGETSSTWVNLHDNFTPLCSGPLPDRDPVSGGFLWTSERTGHSHLYLYRDGELHPLTSGPGRVNRVLWADARRALVSGWLDTPTEQHLYEVSVEVPEAPRRLTIEPGWHDPAVHSDGCNIVDRFSSLTVPGRLDHLRRADAGTAEVQCRTLAEERVESGHPYHPYLEHHATPEFGDVESDDGQRLHYRLTRPRGPLAARSAPVIVYVYGGPGAQRVRNEWAPLLLQLLSSNGFGVLELDNRGSSNRDRRFEAPIHGRLGDAEVRDQIRGVHLLADVAWADPGRVGVFGHSYGGYMTLKCLIEAPDVFKAGVAVAPVTDWRLYDTHYTERYLGTPSENPDGYRESGVVQRAGELQRPLLLMHGMADDNVLFTHTTKLMHALQAANRPFELMAYPGSKHALQERDVSIHRFTLLLDFFRRHLAMTA